MPDANMGGVDGEAPREPEVPDAPREVPEVPDAPHVPEPPQFPEPPQAAGLPETQPVPGSEPSFQWEQPSGQPALPGPLPEGRRPRSRVILAAVVAGLVLLSGGIGIGIGWNLTRGRNSPAAEAPLKAVSPSSSANQSLSAQAIAQRVDPAVVDINTVIGGGSFGGTGRGAGTGMIVSSSGEVLTNNHVIAGATSIRVTVSGYSGSYPARVLGVDPSADVALLQIHGLSNLPTVTLADSSTLKVGDSVVAIGNALGQGGAPAVTEGTVSAVGRSITVSDGRGGSESLSGLIQTDAPIQPGDSGGPLVNSSAQVVGMITAAARTTFSESASTVGFAIPSSAALGLVNEIRAGHGSSSIFIGESGFLGVQVQDLDAATAAQLGLNVTSGALVLGVDPGTPAAAAGISQGGVITAIDDRPVASAGALGTAIHQHRPGEQIRVKWVDQNGTHTATVRLITGPAV